MNEVVAEWARTVGKGLLHFVVPIYAHGHRYPELLASGVLLWVEGHPWLATAAHVFDDPQRQPRHIGVGERLLPYDGQRYFSRDLVSVSAEDDNTDLAIVKLADSIAADINPSDCLVNAAPELRNAPAVDLDANFYVLGFPASRQPRQMVENGYEAHPFSFITNELTAEQYRLAGLNSEETLLLHFAKSEIFRGGAAVKGPDLDGVSGGVVWKLPAEPGGEHTLAGIIVRWRKIEPVGIVVTRSTILSVFVLHTLSRSPSPRGAV